MPTAPNFVLFIGRLHPLLVHLPIGFLILLAIVELLGRFSPYKGAVAARGIILCATALSAVVTIICGLMLSTAGGYDSSLLAWHKWMGITLGLVILSAAWGVWQRQPRIYAGALIASVVILVPAAHFGGSLTHGENYLLAYAPAWLRPRPLAPPAVVASTQPLLTPAQAQLYTDLVRPVLAQNCFACHGPDKTSGGLRLDSFAAVTRGGQDGAVVAAGNSSVSLLIQRLSLPSPDSKHMPPDGKPQPSDDQVDLLKWWIDSGALEHQTVVQAKPTDDQLALVSRLMKLSEPVDTSAVRPIAAADARAQSAALATKIGIVAAPAMANQPWLIVNAAVSRSFGDAELAQLAPLAPNIVDLDLAGTHITDAGLATVASMANLQRLRLDRTAITDAGLAQLGKLRKLSYLNLYGTHVSDEGLKSLAALPSLRHLYLWQTKVDSAAAAAFAASRTDVSKIDRLKKQIAALEQQIGQQQVEVVQGVQAATQPSIAR